MSLRVRVTLVIAVIGFLITAIVVSSAVILTGRHLDEALDEALVARTEQSAAARSTPPSQGFSDVDRFGQVVSPTGHVHMLYGTSVIPIPAGLTSQLPPGQVELYSTTINGEPARAAIRRVSGGWVVFAETTTRISQISSSMGQALAFVGIAVSALAAGLGWILVSYFLRPLTTLTRLTQRISREGVLDAPDPPATDDEVGQLSKAFGTMIRSLAESQRLQNQLVQDAGHELRTPISSISANAETLLAFPDLSRADQTHIAGSIVSEASELGDLVNSLVELTTAEDEEPTRITVGEIIGEVVQRVPAPGRYRLCVNGVPVHAIADPAALPEMTTPFLVRPRGFIRALLNVIFNALKFDAGDTPIDITVGRVSKSDRLAVTVADHGPGVSSEELPHLVERFWRTPSARGKPGSGLGLSIVADIVSLHQGTMTIDHTPGGGLTVRIEVPTGL